MGGGVSAGRPVVVNRDPAKPPASLSPEERDTLLRASLVLSKAPPMSEADRDVVGRALPGAAVISLIRERDQNRGRLADRTRALEEAERQRRDPPEHGTPPNDQMMAELRGEIDTLRAEVERLNGQIGPLLDGLGVAPGEQGERERAMVRLIEEDFPPRFLERGRQIANTMLDQNQRIVGDEIARYAGVCSTDPSDRDRLRTAAQRLNSLVLDVEDLRRQEQALVADLPDGGVTPTHERLGAMRTRREEREKTLQRQRAETELQFPVLLQVPVAEVATADDEALDRLLGAKLAAISDNINKTRENVASGRLKVWNLPDVVRLTAQDLGVTGNEMLMGAVQQKARQQDADEAMVQMAVAAVGITAGLIATLASGGLALGAAVVAAGAGAYQLSESVQNFMAESAASNVALDPRIADLSANEPDMFAVAMDIAGLVLDVADVLKAVNALRAPTKLLLEGGDAAEFIRAAHGTLPPAAAERAVAGVMHRAAGQRAIRTALRAVKGTEFSAHSLAKINKILEEVAEDGWAKLFAQLSPKRVHPLTEKALERVYGAQEVARLRAEGALAEDCGGLFIAGATPGTGHIFLREGRLADVASVVVHELTHHLQDIHKSGIDKFTAEFQAWLAQQEFLRRLAAQGGAGNLADDLRVILESEPWMIANSIVDKYEIPRLPAYSAVRETQDVLTMLKKIRTP
ncbi:hypothetical protein FrEUN1fDRAFT_6945 [Parafrankia sp. EUN1f]|nr:hypothetical protein FrEUN1fDRAFT_6945 [Parafrankia sp. EUN1f]